MLMDILVSQRAMNVGAGLSVEKVLVSTGHEETDLKIESVDSWPKFDRKDRMLQETKADYRAATG